jgi:hypothetical protein
MSEWRYRVAEMHHSQPDVAAEVGQPAATPVDRLPEPVESVPAVVPGQEPWDALDGPVKQTWVAQIRAFRVRLWEEALRLEVEINGREKERPTELTSRMIKAAYKECTSVNRKTQTAKRVWRVLLALVGGLAALMAGVFSNHIDDSWGFWGPIGLAICAAIFAAAIVLSAVISGDSA